MSDYLKRKVQELKEQGVYRELPVNYGKCGAILNLDGKEVINLTSNNYLGLAGHPEVISASRKATDEYGVGAGAVRTIVGNMDLHEELEHVLATFKQEEAVTVFQSGFNCNMGTIQAVTDRGDLIVSDELNHASIIDGVRLSRADKAIYKHSDMDDLRRVLVEKRKDYNQVLIITDGVFSMDGDIAKLPEIVALANEFDCMTYVDDAHGSGVLGDHGRGTVDHFNLHGKVDFIMGTLSKAVGVMGGYIAGSKESKQWLLHRGRPILFSTALPPGTVAAIIQSIKVMMRSDDLHQKLWENAKYFKTKMQEAGFDIGNSETPITPIIIGDEAKTMVFSKRLLEKGVYVSGIVFPTVPKGTGRLRCMITAEHTKEMLDNAVQAFIEVQSEV